MFSDRPSAWPPRRVNVAEWDHSRSGVIINQKEIIINIIIMNIINTVDDLVPPLPGLSRPGRVN